MPVYKWDSTTPAFHSPKVKINFSPGNYRDTLYITNGSPRVIINALVDADQHMEDKFVDCKTHPIAF